MLEDLLTTAVPLILAALGALLTELSGCLGIFIDGFMVFGSFFSFVCGSWTASLFWGCFLSALGAGVIGFALARFVRISGANPFIVGLAFNTFAGALTASCSAMLFGTKGVVRVASVAIPQRLSIFSGYSVFVYVSWLMVIIVTVVLHTTTVGFRLRAAGRSAQAALERGLHPERYREGAWACAAVLAALAGAALTFRIGAYTPGGVAGRGWIALATVYLGFRTVWGTVLAAVLCAAADHIGLSLQRVESFPITALLGIPSALALVLYTVACIFKKEKD
ncbi:MAG: ABC transporter permease [Treponema sp.]|jgi:simple sugar transport system permease protein|nr:ABC transporter permease [Treponema sp.]